ncbi:ribonuclease III [Cloacibacterium sp.]|mgnify:FL=1|jgi:ribonuclease-3|uniref:ribonuclease III n=1 Tax=Cloacibacterium sp. TaxID=1913682 RepID=UPI0035B4E640
MGLKNSLQRFLLKKTFRKKTEKEILLSSKINKIIGRRIDNIDFYKEAFSLKIPNKNIHSKNYERLEFLGDSVLGSIISCYLFKTYPFENEGFLTQMKSKIVNRKNLNLLGEKLRLTDFIQNGSHGSLGENISGNLFEAFIGAIYLDFGYETCQDIVLERLFSEKDIERLEHKIVSYKGLLLEWSQKKKVSIKYETTEEILPNKSFIFRTCVYLNQEKIASATESSKKKAEEKAAHRAFYSLNKKENIVEKQKNIS